MQELRKMKEQSVVERKRLEEEEKKKASEKRAMEKSLLTLQSELENEKAR